jgi:hypothetical protein
MERLDILLNDCSCLTSSAKARVVEVKSIIVCLIIVVCVPLVLMSSWPLFHDTLTRPSVPSDVARASVCTDARDRLGEEE